MAGQNSLFEDSRDFAKYIVEELNDALPLPDDKGKMMRRLARESHPLSGEVELQALQKIMNILVHLLAGETVTVPMEMITILYSLAEMIAIARDDQSGGALLRLRQAFEDDPEADQALMGLHDDMLAAQVREVMVLHGLQNLVLADYQGDVDLDWMNEFGSRLIAGSDPFGFDPALTRILLTEGSATLLAAEGTNAGVTRYVVVTYDPAPENPAWLSRMGEALAVDIEAQKDSGEETVEGDGFFRPIVISVAGDTADMLAEFARQLWQTMPDTLLVAVAEDEADQQRFMQALLEGVVASEPATRMLH